MSAIGSRILEEFPNKLNELSLEPGERVLVAWSGGMDSTLLLYLLKFHSNLTPLPAYFNHHLRSPVELQREIRLLKDTASLWGLPLRIGEPLTEDRWEFQRNSGVSMEEWARNQRYAFLESAAEEEKARAILTAHHQDDWLETQVQRFFQGYSALGLGDLRETHFLRVPVYRPLLEFSRRELEEAAEKFSLPWSEDSSNQETLALRNRIRKDLLPRVEKIFPHFRSALQGGAHRNRLLRESLEKNLKKILPQDKREIQLDLFCSQTPWFRSEILFLMIDRVLKNSSRGIRIPYRFIRDLAEGSLEQPFRREGHGVLISCDGVVLRVTALEKSLEPPLKEIPLIPGRWTELSLYRVRIDDTARPGYYCRLPEKNSPWVLRGRREGDRMGKPGRLKKKLYSYPPGQRDQIPLLASGQDIILILDGKKPELSLPVTEESSARGYYLSLEEKVIISEKTADT